MDSRTMASVLVLLVWFCLGIEPIVAPFPPCSPFAFVNRVVESDELGWLTRDLPGHPVAKECPYPTRQDAPPNDRSLLAYFAQDPNRLVEEIRLESDWFVEKGIPRMNQRFWNQFGRLTGLKKATIPVEEKETKALPQRRSISHESAPPIRETRRLLRTYFKPYASTSSIHAAKELPSFSLVDYPNPSAVSTLHGAYPALPVKDTKLPVDIPAPPLTFPILSVTDSKLPVNVPALPVTDHNPLVDVPVTFPILSVSDSKHPANVPALPVTDHNPLVDVPVTFPVFSLTDSNLTSDVTTLPATGPVKNVSVAMDKEPSARAVPVDTAGPSTIATLYPELVWPKQDVAGAEALLRLLKSNLLDGLNMEVIFHDLQAKGVPGSAVIEVSKQIRNRKVDLSEYLPALNSFLQSHGSSGRLLYLETVILLTGNTGLPVFIPALVKRLESHLPLNVSLPESPELKELPEERLGVGTEIPDDSNTTGNVPKPSALSDKEPLNGTKVSEELVIQEALAKLPPVPKLSDIPDNLLSIGIYRVSQKENESVEVDSVRDADVVQQPLSLAEGKGVSSLPEVPHPEISTPNSELPTNRTSKRNLNGTTKGATPSELQVLFNLESTTAVSVLDVKKEKTIALHDGETTGQSILPVDVHHDHRPLNILSPFNISTPEAEDKLNLTTEGYTSAIATPAEDLDSTDKFSDSTVLQPGVHELEVTSLHTLSPKWLDPVEENSTYHQNNVTSPTSSTDSSAVVPAVESTEGTSTDEEVLVSTSTSTESSTVKVNESFDLPFHSDSVQSTTTLAPAQTTNARTLNVADSSLEHEVDGDGVLPESIPTEHFYGEPASSTIPVTTMESDSSFEGMLGESDNLDLATNIHTEHNFDKLGASIEETTTTADSFPRFEVKPGSNSDLYESISTEHFFGEDSIPVTSAKTSTFKVYESYAMDFTPAYSDFFESPTTDTTAILTTSTTATTITGEPVTEVALDISTIPTSSVQLPFTPDSPEHDEQEAIDVVAQSIMAPVIEDDLVDEMSGETTQMVPEQAQFEDAHYSFTQEEIDYTGKLSGEESKELYLRLSQRLAPEAGVDDTSPYGEDSVIDARSLIFDEPLPGIPFQPFSEQVAAAFLYNKDSPAKVPPTESSEASHLLSELTTFYNGSLPTQPTFTKNPDLEFITVKKFNDLVRAQRLAGQIAKKISKGGRIPRYLQFV